MSSAIPIGSEIERSASSSVMQVREVEALTGAFSGSELILDGNRDTGGLTVFGEESNWNRMVSLCKQTATSSGKYLSRPPSGLVTVLLGRELDKQEVEQPEVDRFDLDEPRVGKLELD
ncbi:hypothetical protein Tco_0194073 [Tanacetum coccineum]